MAMALRDKVCTIHLVQFILPIGVLCYTYGAMAMALRDKVGAIHLVQFILPIGVLCYTYGAMAMALRDKVCTIRLVQFIHVSQRQDLYHPSCAVHPWLS